MEQSSARLPAGQKRVSAVEFWRFVFTVMVSLYHLEIFFMKKSLFPSGSGAVEFFFVLAGFLLAMGAEKRHLRRGGAAAPPKARTMRRCFPAAAAGVWTTGPLPPGRRGRRSAER